MFLHTNKLRYPYIDCLTPSLSLTCDVDLDGLKAMQTRRALDVKETIRGWMPCHKARKKGPVYFQGGLELPLKAFSTSSWWFI